MLSQLVGPLFELYSWIILARLLLSWVRLDFDHPIVTILYRLTEPVLLPARKLIPPAGGIDFSPIMVFVMLRLVRAVVVTLLWRIGL